MTRKFSEPHDSDDFPYACSTSEWMYCVFEPDADDSDSWEWIDPVTEIEDGNHSHNDLLAHRLATPNAQLIDYHNLNCDGNVKPPAELDNVAGRPCFDEFKNTGPTPEIIQKSQLKGIS